MEIDQDYLRTGTAIGSRGSRVSWALAQISCFLTHALTRSSLILLILYVDHIERVTGMTTDELVAVSQDRDSSDRTATKQLLISWILFDREITAV